MYGSNQNGQTAPSGPTQLPNLPAPNVGNYPPNAQAKLNTIYNAYLQSAANQSYYASQYANRPGNHFVAPSLANQLQQIKDSVMNGSLRPDVDQSRWEFVLDCVQTGLDVVGMVPVVGEVADGINVGIHAYRGNYTEAALSAAAMVPWMGAGVTAAKFTRNIGKVGNVVPVNSNQVANLTSIRGGIAEANQGFSAGVAAKVGMGFDPTMPLGRRGPISGRVFDPSNAGGPIRQLTTKRIKITDRGITYAERHLSRFGPDAANEGMVQRLRDIAAGKLVPTQVDLNFYSHELRESIRYRRLGFPSGQPLDAEAAFDLWNNAHSASLENYLLREGRGVLYHSSVVP